MSNWNPKNWSMRDEILNRANKEANYKWSKSPAIPIPKFPIQKVEKIKLSAGVFNLVRQMLP